MTVLIRKNGWQNSLKCWRIPKENVSDFSVCFPCLCNFKLYPHIHSLSCNYTKCGKCKYSEGFQCLIKYGRKDESKNKERAFTSLPILLGIAVFPNIKRMFWLTSIWHACTQRHQNCKKSKNIPVALLRILLSPERHTLAWNQFRDEFQGFTKGIKCRNDMTQSVVLPSLSLGAFFRVWYNLLRRKSA